MNAEQAHTLAVQNAEKRVEREFDQVKGEIKRAVDEGNFLLELRRKLDVRTKAQLMSEGFRVSPKDNNNSCGNLTLIGW